MALAFLLAFAPDPEAQMLEDLGTRLDLSWFVLAMLIPVAIVVLWFGNRSFRHFRGAGQLEPRGRPFFSGGTGPEPEFDKVRLRLEQLEPTTIAGAPKAVIRIEGVIVNSAGTLGGAPGRECVWRSRVGGRPGSAIASEAIVVADATGKMGVEALETAQVTAPHEKHSIHHESMGLYIGDKIEVIGQFVPEMIGEDADPTQIVYGTMGARGPMLVRVLDRPKSPTESESDEGASTPSPETP